MMPGALLATKLHIPPPARGLVLRWRLLEELDAGLQLRRRLALVSAPAGYGKSTLVSEWIHSKSAGRAEGIRFAWLSLDDGDNDPIRFLHYLLGALRQVQSDLGQETMSCLRMPILPPVESVLLPLINELVLRNEGIVLALDDYHCITSETVHEIVRFLLEGNHPLHLVIITREDPPLPLSRLRAREQITELRAAQLRFTVQEVERFFDGRGIKLTPEWLELLEIRNEGWVTGLVLAAISLKDREDLPAFFQSFSGSHRLVIDYLFDEVLARISAETRQFMQQTAILERFNEPLCEAVTGNSKAAKILSQVEKANLFLMPLDDQRKWFRYHHLFAEILVAELIQSEPGIVEELHRRAAVWLNKNGQPTPAIQHALAARDLPLALEIIRQWIDAREKSGAYAELAGWFRAIPDDVFGDDLRLLYRKLRIFYRSGDYERCEQVRAYLERRLDQTQDDQKDAVRWLRVGVLFEKAVFASMRAELDQADQFLREAGQLAKPEDAREQLQLAFYQGVNCTYRGYFDEALNVYQVCLDLNLKEKLYWNAANCLANMLDIYCTLGQFQRAIDTGEDFIERYSRNLVVPGYLEGLHAALGVAYYATNQLNWAEHRLRQTYESSLVSGSDDNYGGWRLWLAAVCSAQGKTADAEGLIQKSEPWVAGFPGEQSKLFAWAIRARIRLAQGNLTEPQSWARRFAAERHKPYFKEFENQTLAWLWLEEGRPSEALTLLQECLPEIEGRCAGCYLVENLALQALALNRLARQDEALEQLHRSLKIAGSQRQDRIFINLGLEMAGLLERLHVSMDTGSPARIILNRLMDRDGPDPEPLRRPPLAGLSPERLAEPFGEREVEILHLIAAGLSNKEIARQMHLSISTIKWYTYHLYAKLSVSSRTQAVQRARDLKLI